MAANVFQAFYETETLGQFVAGPDRGGFRTGSGLEWADQKTEDPYAVTAVDPGGSAVHIEIVNSPVFQGSQSVWMRQDINNNERRCQLSEYNNSALTALTNSGPKTMWTRMNVYLGQNMVMPRGSPFPYIRMHECISFNPNIPTNNYGCPALMFLSRDFVGGAGPTDTNQLYVNWAHGGFGSNSYHQLSELCVLGWNQIITRTLFGTASNGEYQVFLNGISAINQTGVTTYIAGDNNFLVTNEFSGLMPNSGGTWSVYYDDYQVNQDNIWATTATPIGGFKSL